MRFLLCSPFGLFTLHSGPTPPHCVSAHTQRSGGLHEEAWHVTVASASCDVVQTLGPPLFQTMAVDLVPGPAEPADSVLMPLWAMQLWVSAAEKRYWIWSVHLGANIWAVRSFCEQGSGDVTLKERAARAHNTNTLSKSHKNELTRKQRPFDWEKVLNIGQVCAQQTRVPQESWVVSMVNPLYFTLAPAWSHQESTESFFFKNSRGTRVSWSQRPVWTICVYSPFVDLGVCSWRSLDHFLGIGLNFPNSSLWRGFFFPQLLNYTCAVESTPPLFTPAVPI